MCINFQQKMNAKCLHFGTLLGRFLRRKMVIFVSLCCRGFRISKKCQGRSQKDAKLGGLGTQNSQFGVLLGPAGPLFGALGCKRSYFGSPIHCERVNFEFFYGNCIFLHSTHGNAMQKRQRPPPSSAAGPRSRAAVHTCNRLLCREHIL